MNKPYIYVISSGDGTLVPITGASLKEVLASIPTAGATANMPTMMQLHLPASVHFPLLYDRVIKLMDYIRTHDLHKEMDGVKVNLISQKILELFGLKIYDKINYTPYFASLNGILLEAIVFNLKNLPDKLSGEQLSELARKYYPMFCQMRKDGLVTKEVRRRISSWSWFDDYDAEKNTHRITHAALKCEHRRTDFCNFMVSHQVDGWGFSHFHNYMIVVLKAIFTALEEEQT